MTKGSTRQRQACLSASTEDYLREMWLIEERGEQITTHLLASSLSVSDPSATQKMHHLASLGLVVCTPYGPTRLTEEGRRAAADVTQRYELARIFLTSILGYSDEIASAEANRLEHALSPKLQSRMAARIKIEVSDR